MFGNPIFSAALAQALAHKFQHEAALAAAAHASAQAMQPRQDNDVIDVEARVVEDVPALPAPGAGDAS